MARVDALAFIMSETSSFATRKVFGALQTHPSLTRPQNVRHACFHFGNTSKLCYSIDEVDCSAFAVFR
jgi:hypothetical protein